MNKDFSWIHSKNSRPIKRKSSTAFVSLVEAEKVRAFHRSFKGYQITPLANLSKLACHLGVRGLFVKDESYRFGLNAFKALGGSYAIGKYLAGQLGLKIEDVSFEQLKCRELNQKLGQITFATATDGNHGRGVAWSARQLGQKSIVYMPKGSAPIRLNNIKTAGAEAYITEFNYDDTVRLTAENAKKHGWVIIQDTSWPGYEEIPTWIMQGYATMALEALEQLNRMGIKKPTHIFIQAGVGSLPGAIQAFFTSCFGEDRPVITVVEPNSAACIFKSAQAGDNKPYAVKGDMDTIMAGLACGEPNPAAWEVLRDYSDMFISCPDYVAAKGMRLLANPLGEDPRVISGESGAVTTGLISMIMQRPELEEVREILKLNSESIVLLFSTEGDTDPEMYRKVVWDGAFPSL